MGNDRGDNFPFDFETNGVPFEPNENFPHDHIPFNLKGNGNIVLLMVLFFLFIQYAVLKEIGT